MSRMRLAAVVTALSLSFAAVSPAFAAAPVIKADKKVQPGTHNVLMLSYPLSKSCTNYTTVRSMTLLYVGSSPKNIRRVYAKVNGKLLTTKRTISNENFTTTLWFEPNNAPGVCYSGSIDVYADFAGSAKVGSFNSLNVELATDVIANEGSIGVPTHGLWVKVIKKEQ